MKDLPTSVGRSSKTKSKTSSKDDALAKKKVSPKIKDSSSHIKDPLWRIRDKIFKIKIADLLNETGKQDEVVFEHKFSDQLPHLDDQGISWSVMVQSLDATSLLGTLTDVTARFDETCDSCWNSFIRTVSVPSYIGRFVFEDEAKKEEVGESEEVLFFIDSKSETINIEDMVVQAILLDEPFVKRCDTCTKRLANLDDEDELDEFDEYESKGNVIFS